MSKSKYVFLLLLDAAIICSCTGGGVDWAKTCKNGGVYKEHNYTADYDLFGDLVYECSNCGLKYRYIDSLEYPKHYGAIKLYKNPNTCKFDTYVLSYLEDGEYVYERVWLEDLVVSKAKNEEECDTSVY